MSMEEIFGAPIYTYAQADAVRDGVLVEVPRAISTEAGITWPVLMTRAAWLDAVQWGEAEAEAKPHAAQDQEGRLWDVLSMCRWAVVRAGKNAAPRLPFEVRRIPRDGQGLRPTVCRLVVSVGCTDAGVPCLTIMEPTED